MIHKVIEPSDNLNKYFSSFHLFRNKSKKKTVYPFKAGPKIAIAFCFAGSCQQDFNGKLTRIPEISVIGPVLSPYSVVFSENKFGMILAEFTETGYYSLFGKIPPISLNSFLYFRDIATAETFNNAKDLINKLKGRAPDPNRMIHLEGFLSGCKRQHDSSSVQMVKDAVEIIKQSVSDVVISTLCRKLNTNERTLQRCFKKVTGLTPKQYADILRFTKLFDFLMTDEKANLIKKLYALGYCDQAHAIREFKKYAGYTPQKIMQENFQFASKLSSFFADSICENY